MVVESESLEGGTNNSVTERLGGTKVVPQQPIIPFQQLRPFDMGPQPPKLLNLHRERRKHLILEAREGHRSICQAYTHHRLTSMVKL